MKNIGENTVKKQVMSILKAHAAVNAAAAVVGFGGFWWFLAQSVWSRVYSGICMIIYFYVMYTAGRRAFIADNRSNSLLKPFWQKGFLLGAAASVSVLVFWTGFRLVWLGASPDGLVGVWRSVYNIFFILYTFVYNGIMSPYRGGIFWYAHIAMYALPIIGAGMGYAAAYKGINISDTAAEKLKPFMYEKDNNN